MPVRCNRCWRTPACRHIPSRTSEEKQIDSFLERWHRLAFPGALDAGAQRLERLRRTLQENRPVRDLCGNPLLLTLIALLNRGGELPKQRHRVYERTVELMAEHWEANKHLGASRALGFDLADKKRFLRQLAFHMMVKLPDGAGNAIRQRDLVSFAAKFCAHEYTLDSEAAQARAEQLIAHLRERNYVLTLLGGQTFGFVHKTFLEYLTAAEIHAQFQRQDWTLAEIKEVFKTHWQDQAWEETLTLICGMLEEERPEQVVELLQAVLRRIDPFGVHSIQPVVAFATRCIVEVRQLEQEPVRSFAQRLTDVMVQSSRRWHSVDKILSSFRLCGSAWPGASRILEATRKSISQQERTSTVQNRDLSNCLFSISLCSPPERVNQLKQLVANNSPSFLLGSFIREAARLGNWSEQEILSLEQLIERSPETVRISAWIALLTTGVRSAISRIADILRRSKHWHERTEAAVTLARFPEWRTEAVDTLLTLWQSPPQALSIHGMEDNIRSLVEAAAPEPSIRARVRSLLSSKIPHIRYAVAREMALLWRDNEALQIGLMTFRTSTIFLVTNFQHSTIARVTFPLHARPSTRSWTISLPSRTGLRGSPLHSGTCFEILLAQHNSSKRSRSLINPLQRSSLKPLHCSSKFRKRRAMVLKPWRNWLRKRWTPPFGNRGCRYLLHMPMIRMSWQFCSALCDPALRRIFALKLHLRWHL